MQSSAQRQTSAEFTDLAQFVDCLPEERRRSFQIALEKATNSSRRLASTIQWLREAFGQFRLDAHYLLFDLEATRRERDQLQRRLDDLTRGRR